MDFSRTLAGQRHVGPDAQASSDALPAILSENSVLSVVKNRRAFLPQIAQRTQMNHKAHNRARSLTKENRCFHAFAPCGTDKFNLEHGIVVNRLFFRNSPEITSCFYCGEKSQPETSVRDFSSRHRSLAYASGCDFRNLFRDWSLLAVTAFSRMANEFRRTVLEG